MKKQNIVLVLFFVYVIPLLFLAGYYEIRDQNLAGKGFGSIGESLGLFSRYTMITFLGSSAFLIIVFFIQNKLSILFIFLAPFLNMMVALVVGLFLNFVLWITRLENSVSFFQQVFIIGSFSTLATTLWLLGDVFKSGNERTRTRTM